MQRRLILMRHAKSDWSSAGMSDHERPLNNRGRKAAPAMARSLLAQGWLPDAVCLSDSMRTTETWERLAHELDSQVVPRAVPDLYLAGPHTILEVVANLPGHAQCGLLLGHNPGMSEAATLLAGHDLELRTADAALFTAEAPTWRIPTTSWQLVTVLRAREAD